MSTIMRTGNMPPPTVFLVGEHEKPVYLPLRVGKYFMRLEMLYGSCLQQLTGCNQASLNIMDIPALGAFFLSPARTHETADLFVKREDGRAVVEMSSQAAGIVATLCALQHLLPDVSEDATREQVSEIYQRLRNWCLTHHPEAAAINRAIN